MAYPIVESFFRRNRRQMISGKGRLLLSIFALAFLSINIADQLTMNHMVQRILMTKSHVIATENVSLTIVGVEGRKPNALERMHLETSLFYHLNDALKNLAVQTSNVSIRLDTIKIQERTDGNPTQLDLDLSIAARFQESHASDFSSLLTGSINFYSNELLHALKVGTSLEEEDMSAKDYYKNVSSLVCNNAVVENQYEIGLEDRQQAAPFMPSSDAAEDRQKASSFSPPGLDKETSTEDPDGAQSYVAPIKEERPNFVSSHESNESEPTEKEKNSSDEKGTDDENSISAPLAPGNIDQDKEVTSSDSPLSNEIDSHDQAQILKSKSKASYYRTIAASICVSVCIAFIVVNIVRVNIKQTENKKRRIEHAKRAYKAPLMLAKVDHRGQSNIPMYDFQGNEEQYMGTMDSGDQQIL